MAITVWVGPNAGGGGNSLYASQDLGTALVPYGQSGAGGPATGAYLYGFFDSEQRARTFYSSSSNSINLPTLVAPPVVPLNFVDCGSTATNGVVYQLVQTGSDYGATVAGNGVFLVTISFSAGSPDSASPFQFTLDAGAVLIVSDIAAQGA
jgi:hypothetical protein